MVTGRQYLTADHLGTTRVVTDTSGTPVERADYLPFGEQISVSGASLRYTFQSQSGYGFDSDVKVRFTGKERDAETGLDYFGARYLSSAQGRWMSPDWSSTPQAVPYADLKDPQTLNLYSYVRNNPLSRADLDGHDDDDAKKNAPQAAQGAAASAGTQATNDAAVRARYVQQASQLQPGDTAGRTAIKIEARADTSPGGQVVAETMRPMGQEASRVAGTVTKTSEGVNAAMETAGRAGPALMVVAVAASTYNVATAENKTRALAQEGGAWAGALSFGGLGAKGGAVVGAFIGGPVGAGVGAIVGGLGGGIVGGIVGSRAATSAYDLVNPK
jgi:RHS repeat-associated protein